MVHLTCREEREVAVGASLVDLDTLSRKKQTNHLDVVHLTCREEREVAVDASLVDLHALTGKQQADHLHLALLSCHEQREAALCPLPLGHDKVHVDA